MELIWDCLFYSFYLRYICLIECLEAAGLRGSTSAIYHVKLHNTDRIFVSDIKPKILMLSETLNAFIGF